MNLRKGPQFSQQHLWWRVERETSQGQERIREMTDMFVVLVVMMDSWQYVFVCGYMYTLKIIKLCILNICSLLCVNYISINLSKYVRRDVD